MGIAGYGTAVAAALLLGFSVGYAPVPIVAMSMALPLLFLRRARLRALAALIAVLVTTAHAISVATVASIPVGSLSLMVLALAFRQEIGQALAELPALRAIAGVWIIWLAWTLVRLAIDLPVYGVIALRDAAPVIDFGSVLLGAAAVFAYSSEDRSKFIPRIVLLLAGYGLLFPLWSAGYWDSAEYISFENAGIAGLTVYGAGLWSQSSARRVAYLSLGLSAIAVSQVRMMYIATIVLTLVFLSLRSGRSEPTDQPLERPVTRSRIGAIACLVAATATMLVVLPSVPFLTGRVGAVSWDTMTTQLSQVADPEGENSGSVGDRTRWWGTIMSEMTASPTNIVMGMGLGKDLLDGYRSRDGALVRKPHNDALEWFAREGLIGILGVGTILVGALVFSWRCLRADPANGPLFAWSLGAILTALSQPYLAYAHGVIPIGLLLGYTLAMSKLRSRDAPPVDTTARQSVLVP